MATKRPFSEVHPSRREQVPGQSRKKQKPDNLGPKSFKKAHPVNELKSRIRNLTRLLARDDDRLSADVRVTKERELQNAEHELRESQAADKKSKIIARYHKVRFFDKKKAEKRLKKAKKLLHGAEETDLARIRQDIEEAEVNVKYAIYYPLDLPYHSLYPREDAQQEDEDTTTLDHAQRGDPEMRELVKKCFKDDTLEALKNGELTAKSEPPKDTKTTEKTGNKATKSQDAEEDEDGHSDGGFFE